MGVYGDPNLLKWFTNEYGKQTKTKLDMGKGCIRFKKMDDIPYQLIGDLATKMTPQEWVNKYVLTRLNNTKQKEQKNPKSPSKTRRESAVAQ